MFYTIIPLCVATTSIAGPSVDLANWSVQGVNAAVHVTGGNSSRIVQAVATLAEPARVSLDRGPLGINRTTPQLLVLDVGRPMGVTNLSQLVGKVDLIFSGEPERRIKLGSVNFFGAEKGSSFAFDLTKLSDLTKTDLQSLIDGPAAVELTLAVGKDSVRQANVPVLQARLIPPPPP